MNWLKTIEKEIDKVKKAYFKGWEGCEYKSCEVTILDTPDKLRKVAVEMVYIEHPEGVEHEEFSGKKVLLVNKNKHLEV